MMNLLELPPDFIHEPPEGYAYEVKPFKRNIVAIWHSIPIITILVVIVFLRSGGSTIQSREPIQRLLMPPSVEIR